MATTAAALMAKARRDVVSHFMAANAVSAESAVAYAPGRNIRQREFERLCDAGVIRAAGDGRYWIDVPRFEEWSRSRRRRVILAIAALLLIVAVMGLIVR
ncbi:hypothetical protein [Sphingomonas sp.]|uniref:hypothetical protein n=1 Tax=Sphingomonas sp. TaxID=28214 RepID=UPI00286C6577|nr:hypothetical protein [Sphingomonas sp.]